MSLAVLLVCMVVVCEGVVCCTILWLVWTVTPKVVLVFVVHLSIHLEKWRFQNCSADCVNCKTGLFPVLLTFNASVLPFATHSWLVAFDTT